jgi:hypothetical protein
MWSREDAVNQRKDVGEDECMMSTCECWKVFAVCSDAIVKRVRHEDTPHRRRDAAGHWLDLKFPLGRIYITFRNEPPGNLALVKKVVFDRRFMGSPRSEIETSH